jgi:hypothetical protein
MTYFAYILLKVSQQRQFQHNFIRVYFFIRSVYDTIFAMIFLPKPPADRHGQPGDPPRTTVWETLL